jgi:hypothetical protein
LEIADVTLSREGALSVLDWDATLKSAPDLKSLTRDGNPQAFAMSACDGNWTLFLVSAKAEEITKLSAEAGVSAGHPKLKSRGGRRLWSSNKKPASPRQKKAREAAEDALQKARTEAQVKAKAASMPSAPAPPGQSQLAFPPLLPSMAGPLKAVICSYTVPCRMPTGKPA